MKHHISICVDSRLFREIEELRGLTKRSTFYEELLKEGLKEHRNKQLTAVNRALETAPWR